MPNYTQPLQKDKKIPAIKTVKQRVKKEGQLHNKLSLQLFTEEKKSFEGALSSESNGCFKRGVTDGM